ALSGKVAGGAKGPRILAALVLVLGVMSNVGGALAYPDTVPAWYLWSLPFCGMLGVMVGAQLVSPGSGGEDGSGGAPASS
ncbi:MAG: hypothetical protein QF599_08170, partial [Planctomycetota bacterium]|nr:hypothetical protein [Planctomycetota bacterium]